jgi:signal transduction histidine kinase
MRRLPGDPDLIETMARVQQTRQPGLGAFATTAQKKLILPILGPVIDKDGKVPYLFFVTVDLKWLDEQVNRIVIPNESILLVMDRHGAIMARNPHSGAFPVGASAPPFERTLPAQPDFSGEVKGEGGVDRVYSVTHVGSADALTVVMKERSSEIYKAAKSRLAVHLAGLGGVGLLVLGLAWLGSDRYFTRPMFKLIRTADRIAAGDRSARTGLKYTGEIGGLAQSFDLMAATLEQEQVRTSRTSRTFRSIIEGTSTSTGEEFFRSLVKSLTSALEADFALVGEVKPDLRSVHTLAACLDGRVIENMDYPLEGTPCENVLNVTGCYYPSGIQAMYPKDAMLARFKMESYLGTPLVNEEGRPIGLIAVTHRKPISSDVTDPLSMLNVFAARASVELTRLRVEHELRESLAERKLAADLNLEMVRTLRALTARLESVREEERSHIAREIHDELGQQLTAMRFSLKSLKNHLAQRAVDHEPVPSVPGRISELTGLVDSMIGDIRRIATELRPQVLDAFGIIAAIEWLAEDFQNRTGIVCRYDGPKDLTVQRELATAVFRICQESLTNIARHARATEARIHLALDNDWLSLSISDNGRGISPEALANSRSLGVVGMRERARMAGGELVIDMTPGKGASVRVRFPFVAARGETSEAALR